MYGYRGTVSALRATVEYIAIKHNVIPKVVEIPLMAWGVPGECPRYESNTNLTDENLDLFTEEVHILVNHNILSPGHLADMEIIFLIFMLPNMDCSVWKIEIFFHMILMVI